MIYNIYIYIWYIWYACDRCAISTQRLHGWLQHYQILSNIINVFKRINIDNIEYIDLKDWPWIVGLKSHLLHHWASVMEWQHQVHVAEQRGGLRLRKTGADAIDHSILHRNPHLPRVCVCGSMHAAMMAMSFMSAISAINAIKSIISINIYN